MTSKSHLRGHKIEYVNGRWIYSDTKEATDINYETRPCGYCGKGYTPEGHDACIGTLSNVMNACCGHGEEESAYVQFWDKTSLRGAEATEYFRKARK